MNDLNLLDNTRMTLTEYINQKDPVRMPTVFLTPDEYTMGVRIERPFWGSETSVFITAEIFNKAFPTLRNEYKLIGDHNRALYTTDYDGNKNGRSCFVILK